MVLTVSSFMAVVVGVAVVLSPLGTVVSVCVVVVVTVEFCVVVAPPPAGAAQPTVSVHTAANAINLNKFFFTAIPPFFVLPVYAFLRNPSTIFRHCLHFIHNFI